MDLSQKGCDTEYVLWTMMTMHCELYQSLGYGQYHVKETRTIVSD